MASGTNGSGELHDTPEALPVLRSTERFRGRLIAVRTDEVRMPDGASAARDVVVHPGAVGVIALDPDERVLLVQQYRHPVGRMLWEPPAGILDVAGEPSLATAQRELFEEAHYRAGRWDVLVDAFTSPGMADEALRIYLARDLSPAEGERHQGEHEEHDMPVAWLRLDEAVRKVLAGELHNPTAVMGILAAAAARRAGFAGLRPVDAPWPERPGSPS
ncbi:MAG TPA: NUDIX hydrolase [Mycobacteriales bacterium]|nr:NUDIX hydrolase [Mycobacteriales bacterium]